MKTFLLIFIFVLAVILTFSLMTSEKHVFAFKPYLYKEITFKTNIPYIYPYNSSISKENNEYVVYTRFDNSGGIINKIKHFFGTPRNIHFGISRFDEDFNLISQNTIQHHTPNCILEDLRVFFFRNKKYFIGTLWNGNFCPVITDEFYQIYDIVDQNLKKYVGDKNFSPIQINNELCFIKNHNPLEILKVTRINNDEHMVHTELLFSSKRREDLPELRGNTEYMYIEGELGENNGKYLGITHVRILHHKYIHYLTLINASDLNNIYIEKISKPMCFMGNCGIEFVMGFIESFDRQNFIITLGKNDTSAHVIFLSKKELFANL